MLIMNGHEFEFDLFELETTKKYEKAFENLMKKMEDAEKLEKLSESIVAQCDAVRACIDKIFGKQTGIEVCGENYNLTKHMEAFEALVDEAIRQRTEHDKRALKYMTEE